MVDFSDLNWGNEFWGIVHIFTQTINFAIVVACLLMMVLGEVEFEIKIPLPKISNRKKKRNLLDEINNAMTNAKNEDELDLLIRKKELLLND